MGKEDRFAASTNKTSTRHKWTVADDEAALSAYLSGLSKKEADIIAHNRGIKPASFWCRIGNFQHIVTEGKKGFSNYAMQSKQVWEAYKSYTGSFK